MVDYSKIITELIEESESCNYRYGGMVPLYYQQQINEADMTCQISISPDGALSVSWSGKRSAIQQIMRN